ncbi:hypothetical protein C4A76_17955 [Brevibacillus laterosporus]|uniref:Uncharacterized protein n=1 Tax=Brevibacillus laterosporus TaxID=1465 RepID=A0AAP8U443_BRELA|nr:hypothetical protein C4A76_17955 [Brevibacillus laterosporus]PPA93671.1 hypothetical protein C4A77_16870 [Brevibacillus laterosporus]
MKKVVLSLFATSLLFSSPVWATDEKSKLPAFYENERVVDVKQIDPKFLSTAKNEVNQFLKGGTQFQLEKIKKFELVQGIDRKGILSFDWSLGEESATVEIEEKTGQILKAVTTFKMENLRSDQKQIVQTHYSQINNKANMNFNWVRITTDNTDEIKVHKASFFWANFNGIPNFIDIDLFTGKMIKYSIPMDAAHADQKYVDLAKQALSTLGRTSQIKEALRFHGPLASGVSEDQWGFSTQDGDYINIGAKTGRVYSLVLRYNDFDWPDKKISDSEVTKKANIILEKAFGMNSNEFTPATKEIKHRYGSYIMEKEDGTVAYVHMTKKGEIQSIRIKPTYFKQE